MTANRSRFRCILHALGSCQKNDVERPEGTLRAAGGRRDSLVEGKIHKALTTKGPKQTAAFMLQKMSFHSFVHL